MSISHREQRTLDLIEDDLARSGQDLASKLAVFTRLAAGEEMPARERIRGAVHPRAPWLLSFPGHQEPPRDAVQAPRWVNMRIAWRLVWLTVTFALLAVAVGFGHGAGNRACLASPVAACRPAHTPASASAQPGKTGNGGL